MKRRVPIMMILMISIVPLLESCKKTPTTPIGALSISNLDIVVTTLPPDQFMSLTFVTATTGYAVSNHGSIIKTKDEGKTWHTIASLGDGLLLTKIQFTDPQNGYVIAGDNNGGYLYKTTDGGDNWLKKDFNPAQAGVPNDMHFINKDLGFVTGADLFIKTSDGGNTWHTVQYSGTYHFNKVNFASSTIGYATCNNGAYFKTTDAGASWESITLNGGLTLTDIYFANNKVFLNASTGLLDISSPSHLTTLPSGATHLLFLDENKCIAAGEHYEGGFWPYGDILITNDFWKTNEKKTFQPSQAYTFKCIAKMSEKKAMAIGYGTAPIVVTINW